MHLVFISSLLTLSHTGLWPSLPAPWPSSTDYILRSNDTYNPTGCSKVEVLQAIHEVLSQFRRGIIGNIARKEPKNFAVSPLAVSLAISLVTSAPAEKDETPSNITKINVAMCVQLMGMQPLIDYLANYRSTGLSLASGVFVSPKVDLRPEFIETVTKTFRSPLRRVDFENAIERTDFISRWGANQTMSLVDANTSLALVNVVHFKGEWLQKFRANDTIVYTSRDYRGITTYTSFMHMTAYLRHGHHPKANATFYELPFKSEDDARNMSMFVITPDLIPGKSTLEFWDNIEEFTIKDLMSYGTYSTIPIRLRKFTIESIIDVEPAAQGTLGKNGIFDSETTKLNGIAKSSNLFGNGFVQRIIMNVDEEGSLAVTSDTFSDPTLPLSNFTLWATLPFYVLIGTTGSSPQVIFAARCYG